MKDKTPYQTGLVKFSVPTGTYNSKFEFTKLPDGVVCTPSINEINLDPNAIANTDEFVASGTKVILGNCVYNIEAVAATLPEDLVVLVNGTEVTIPASSAGVSSFSIPMTTFNKSDEVTWLPGQGSDRPQFVTDNWDKIEKRSFVEDIDSIKNVKSREFSYTVTVKDANSPALSRTVQPPWRLSTTLKSL